MLQQRLPFIASVILIIFSNVLHAQKKNSCANSDFAYGDFTNWVGHTSIYPANTPKSDVGTQGPPYYYKEGIVPGRQTLITTSTPDPFTCGNLLTLPPNEKACVRLGNGGFGPWGDGAMYERDFLSYTFAITPSNPLLIYKYAVVLQDPNNSPHDKSIRPRFAITIKDETGALIDPICGKKEDVADTSVAGFRNCPLAEANKLGVKTPNTGDIVYRAWTSIGVDLRKFVGRNITIEFETWDCGLGAHFGYAYVLARCDSLALITAACTANGDVEITAPDGFAYKWFPGGQTSKSINISNSKPGDSVYVELSTVNGCKTAIGTRIYPMVTKANFNVNPTIVCLDEAINFTDSSYSYLTATNKNIPIVKWDWDFGDSTFATTQNPTHVYKKPGNYKIKLTVVTQNGCTDFITKNVSVRPPPTADFSFKDVCINATPTFTDLSFISGGIIEKWEWTFGDDNSTSDLQNPIHNFKNAGTFTVKLKVTTNNGCTHDTTRTITIFPLPIANYIASTVCVGQPTVFTDLSKQTDPNDNLKTRIWNFGDMSSLSSDPNPTHIYTAAGTFKTYLVVTSARGCIADRFLDVTVHPLPKPNFSATPLCLSTPVQFTDLSTPSPMSKWYWSFGDKANTSSQAQNPQFLYDSAGFYYPKLVVTSEYGCVDSIRMTINLPALPFVNFDANKYKGCKPLCVNFKDYSFSSSDSIKKWEWTFGDDATSSQQNPSHCYVNPGVYTVSLTVETANTCKQKFIWENMMTVYPFPIADFEPNKYVTDESDKLIQFFDKSIGADFWGWSFGDGTGGALTKDASHLYEKTGTYTVWLNVTNKYGCADSTPRQIIINPEWTFFVPNAFTPGASKGINDGFIAYGTNIQDFEMWIFDRWGNKIYTCNSLDQPWNGSVNNGLGGEKTAQQDVYVWKIKFKDCFNQPHHYTGIVTLVR